MPEPMEVENVRLRELLAEAREALVDADSITSYVGYRYPSALPGETVRELLSVSGRCRTLSEAMKVEREV